MVGVWPRGGNRGEECKLINLITQNKFPAVFDVVVLLSVPSQDLLSRWPFL